MRPRRPSHFRVAATLLLGMVALPAASPAAALPPEDQNWLRVDTRNFELFSSAPRLETWNIAQRLEMFRGTLVRLFPSVPPDDALPTYVFVFENGEAFRPYNLRSPDGKPAEFAGFHTNTWFGHYIAIDASPGSRPDRIVYHEYVHYFLSHRHAGLPLWFHEGFAEYFSTATLADGLVVTGQPVRQHVDWLGTERWIPLQEVFDTTARSPLYREYERAGAFYAQSWLLIHYLLQDEGGRGWPPRRLLDLWTSDRPFEQVVLDALGMTAEQLEAALREYAKRDGFGSTTLALDASEFGTVTRARVPDRTALLCRLGELLAFVHEDYAAAEEHFRAALALNENRAAAHTGLGYILQLRGEHEGAARHFDRAIAIRPASAQISLVHGQSCLQRFEQGFGKVLQLGPEPAPLVLQARKLFARSIELDPGLAEAYVGLGDTYLYGPGDPAEGIAALEHARELMPSRMDVAVNLAVLYTHAGRSDEAEALMAVVQRDASDRELVEHARQLLLLSEQVRVRTLVDRGEIAKAAELLESMIAEATHPEVRAGLQRNLALLQAGARHLERVERYNRAVELEQQRKLDAAVKLLSVLREEVQDPDLATQVTEALERLDAVEP